MPQGVEKSYIRRKSDKQEGQVSGWFLLLLLTFERGQDASSQHASGRRKAQHDGARVVIVDLCGGGGRRMRK